MPTIFISHASKDSKICDQVAAHLKNRNYDVFVHRRPSETHLTKSSFWPSALINQILDSSVMILLLSDEWNASPECLFEYMFASRLPESRLKTRNIVIIALKIDKTYQAPNVVSNNLQKYEFSRTPTESQWKIIYQILDANDITPGRLKPNRNRVPFPGVDYFDREDGAYFCGRDFEWDKVIAKLSELRTGSVRKSVLVIGGNSGAGKSSLMRAGVLARLELNSSKWYCPDSIVASASYDATLGDLAEALAPRDMELNRVRDALEADDSGWRIVDLINQRQKKREKPFPTIVVSIDQLEQSLFGEDSEKIVSLLQRLTISAAKEESITPLVILGTMQSNAYPQFCAVAATLDIDVELFSLAPVRAEKREAIVKKPLEIYFKSDDLSQHVDAGVIERILSEAQDLEGGAKEDDVLPLLAILLHKFWEKCVTEPSSPRRFDEEIYKEIAGKDGRCGLAYIVDNLAEKALESVSVSNNGRSLLAKALVPWIATVSATGEFHSASTGMETILGQFTENEDREFIRQALETLAAQRILRCDIGSRRGAEEASELAYTLSHSVVLREWSWLNAELVKRKEELSFMARIETEARFWCEALADAKQRLEVSPRNLEQFKPGEELLFLEGSRLDRAIQLNKSLFARAPEHNNTTRYITACAEKQLDRARSLNHARQQNFVVEINRAISEHNCLSAIRFGLAAWPHPDDKTIPHSKLIAAVVAAALRSRFEWGLRVPGISSSLFAPSPDGEFVACGGRNMELVLIRVKTGERACKRKRTSYELRSLEWAPDSAWIVVSGVDENKDSCAYVFNRFSDESIELNGMDGMRASWVRWSPDGDSLAIGGTGVALFKWTEAKEKTARPEIVYEGKITAMDFSPSGAWLFVGTEKAELVCLDICRGSEIGRWTVAKANPLTGRIRTSDVLNHITCAPKCARLAGYTKSGAVQLWEIAEDGCLHYVKKLPGESTGGPMSRFSSIDKSILAWSPDGRRLACGSGGQIRVWCRINEDKEKLEIVFRDTEARKGSRQDFEVGWLAGDPQLVSCRGGALGFWRLRDDRMLCRFHSLQESLHISWSRCGKYLVGNSSFGELSIWDSTTGCTVGAPIDVREPTEDAYNLGLIGFHFGCSLDWCADGQHIVSCSSAYGKSSKLAVWSTETRKRVHTLFSDERSIEGTTYLRAVSCSPSSSRIVAAAYYPTLANGQVDTDNSQVVIWDINSDSIPLTVLKAPNLKCFAWSHDGARIATLDSNGRIAIWDSKIGEQMLKPLDTGSLPWDSASLAWDPAGGRVAGIGSDYGVKVWDVYSGKVDITCNAERNSRFRSITWSPNGSWILANRSGTLVAWDASSGEQVSEPIETGVPDEARVVWSPDGSKLLVSADTRAWVIAMPQALQVPSSDLPATLMSHNLRGAEKLTGTEVDTVHKLTGVRANADELVRRWTDPN